MRMWRFGFPIGAGGGDSTKVKSELATCNVTRIFSNSKSHVAMCVDDKVIAWGLKNCTPHS